MRPVRRKAADEIVFDARHRKAGAMPTFQYVCIVGSTLVAVCNREMTRTKLRMPCSPYWTSLILYNDNARERAGQKRERSICLTDNSIQFSRMLTVS